MKNMKWQQAHPLALSGRRIRLEEWVDRWLFFREALWFIVRVTNLSTQAEGDPTVVKNTDFTEIEFGAHTWTDEPVIPSKEGPAEKVRVLTEYSGISTNDYAGTNGFRIDPNSPIIEHFTTTYINPFFDKAATAVFYGGADDCVMLNGKPMGVPITINYYGMIYPGYALEHGEFTFELGPNERFTIGAGNLCDSGCGITGMITFTPHP